MVFPDLSQFFALVAIGSFIKNLSDYLASLVGGQEGVTFVNQIQQGASYYFVNQLAQIPIIKTVGDMFKAQYAPPGIDLIVGAITIVFFIWLIFKLV